MNTQREQMFLRAHTLLFYCFSSYLRGEMPPEEHSASGDILKLWKRESAAHIESAAAGACGELQNTKEGYYL